MSTTYHPYKIALTDGQKKKLQKAYVSKTAVTLRVKPGQFGPGDELLPTATQISRLKKTSAAGKGMEIKLSQTQIQNTAQRGGSLFSAMLGLARPLIKPALGGLASAGLSFGAEKVLKKIFGKGFGPKEIQLYKLFQKMTPAQKKEPKQYLVGQGLVKGGGAQYGGFLGMLASIGVLVSQSLVCSVTSANISAGYKTDHSLIDIRIALHSNPRGPGIWKLNTSFLTEIDYVNRIRDVIKKTHEEYQYDDTVNKALLWEMMKLKIREQSIKYATAKKAKMSRREEELEDEINS